MSKIILNTILALCSMVACGPYQDSTLGNDEYASSRQAIESENTSSLLGDVTKSNLRIEHLADSRLDLHVGLQCMKPNVDCTGAVFTAFDSGGIIQISINSRVGNRYKVSYRRVLTTVWLDLCPGKSAIAVPGSWALDGSRLLSSPSPSFTFACEGSAAYKCAIDHKYDPVVHSGHYQACTRMIRADYCGDGRSWTETGTRIDILDDIGIHPSWTHAGSWTPEATWGVNGATCVTRERLIDELEPWEGCLGAKAATSCSTVPFSNAVLMKTLVTRALPSCGACPSGTNCRRKCP